MVLTCSPSGWYVRLLWNGSESGREKVDLTWSLIFYKWHSFIHLPGWLGDRYRIQLFPIIRIVLRHGNIVLLVTT